MRPIENSIDKTHNEIRKKTTENEPVKFNLFSII